MTHALVIGESLIDIVERPGQTPVEHPGGSPMNVAIGLARLGREAHLATWIGKDPRGALIKTHLTIDGVQLVPGSDGAEHTSTAAARLDETGAATYTFELDWRVPEVHLDSQIAVVHTGSIAATLSPGGDAVAEIVRAAREFATISYDPNARPSIMGTPAEAEPKIERIAAAADVIKVSDEDLEWLYPGTAPEEVARTWASQGPALVVVTRGGEGSFAVTSAGVEVSVPAPTVTVADTVGAGDSYMGGLLDQLWGAGLLGAANREKLHAIDAATLTRAMRFAAQVAAITVSRAGANPPRREETLAALAAAEAPEGGE